MAKGQSFRLVSKRQGEYLIGIYYVSATGETRQVALLEVPHDSQWRDNVALVDEVSDAIRKRIKRSI